MAAAGAASSDPPQILVIEDDASLRSVIVSTLARLGYGVRSAENGRKGLESFEREPADLVITDMFMPEMDGVETIAALRALERPPRIIAISGGLLEYGIDLVRIAVQLGADSAQSKPVGMSVLAGVVQRLLDDPEAAPRYAHG